MFDPKPSLSFSFRATAAPFFAAAIFALAVVCFPDHVSAQTLAGYAVADDGNGTTGNNCGGGDQLIRINLNGTFSEVGCLVNGGGTVENMAYNPVNGVLYAANGSGQFGSINTTTGVWTLIGSIGSGFGDLEDADTLNDDQVTVTDIDGLAYLQTGPSTVRLFAVMRRAADPADLLFELNPTTGALLPDAFGSGIAYVRLTIVGNFDVDDISFQPGTNVLYGIANNDGGNDRLCTIDYTQPGAGAMTAIGTQLTNTTGSVQVTDMEGLSFTADGALFGTTGNNSGTASQRNQVWQIGPTTGNVTSRINISSIGVDYEALNLRLFGPLAVDLTSFEAEAYGNRVLLDWQTGTEHQTLGFNVYRESNGSRLRLNTSLIAGSALKTGTIRAKAGSYAWWDDTAGAASGGRYWLEEIDLQGMVTLYGPYVAEGRHGSAPERSDAPSLASASGSSRVTAAPEGAPSALASANANAQFAIASRPAVKISVGAEGWHAVTAGQLIAAGLSPNADPRRLQLYADGIQQSVVVRGQENGRLDATDTLEFYGVPLDTASTDTRVYWLVEGSGAGARVPTMVPAGKVAPGPQAFPATVERKDRLYYFAAITNGDDSNFFGPIVGADPVEQTIELSNVDKTQSVDALLSVTLQGATDLPEEGDHVVSVSLNGTVVGTTTFDGIMRTTFDVRVPHALLANGDNVVTLVSSAGPSDFSLVDSVRITYAHTFVADDNRIDMRVLGGRQVTVGGFTAAGIGVFDVTDPSRPTQLRGTVAARDGVYAITFVTNGTGPRRIVALTSAGVEAPAALRANVPSNWNAIGGQFAIVTHASLAAEVAPLAALRRAQGWTVNVVDVEDVYDEFSFGAKDPEAIRRFVARARTRPDGATHVMLVGDSSFDPRNFLGLGDHDLVPTRLVQTPEVETASDELLADVDGDGVAEVALGRIPARTPAEVAAVVAKLLAYDATPANADWTGRAVLVADDPAEFDFDFNSATENIAALVPSTIEVRKILRSEADAATTRDRILAEFGEGSLLVSYSGHGSSFIWAEEQLLKSSDAPALANGVKLPVVLNMTCYNSTFQDLFTESLSEALLKAPNGGAVAVWGSSGLVEPQAEAGFHRAIVELLFNGDGATLGEKVRQAKILVGNSEGRVTLVLLGDPTLRMRQ